MECGPTWEHILYFVFGRCWLTVDLYTTERLTVETSQSIWKFRLTVLKQWSWKTSRLAVNCHTYHKRNIFFLRKSNMREQTLARRLSFLYTRNSLHEARSIWILKQYLAALHSTTRVWSKQKIRVTFGEKEKRIYVMTGFQSLKGCWIYVKRYHAHFVRIFGMLYNI